MSGDCRDSAGDDMISKWPDELYRAGVGTGKGSKGSERLGQSLSESAGETQWITREWQAVQVHGCRSMRPKQAKEAKR